MGFTFGEKKKDIKESSGTYLRNFRKGETKVRFLQEPGDWHAYYEHFDPGMQKSFACLGSDYRDICPGCTSDNERTRSASRRYGTFVYVVDRKEVQPYKMGQRLSDRLQVRAERNNNTILSRDYVIIKSGSGLDTDYDVDQDERYEVDIEALWAKRGDKEVEGILQEQWIEAFGDPEEFIKNHSNTGKAKQTETNVKKDDDPPPWETKEKSDVEVTEEQLLQMKRSELRAVWRKADLPADEWNDDWEPKEIVAELMKRAS